MSLEEEQRRAEREERDKDGGKKELESVPEGEEKGEGSGSGGDKKDDGAGASGAASMDTS